MYTLIIDHCKCSCLIRNFINKILQTHRKKNYSLVKYMTSIDFNNSLISFYKVCCLHSLKNVVILSEDFGLVVFD